MHVQTRANIEKNMWASKTCKNIHKGQHERTYEFSCVRDNANAVHVQTRVKYIKPKQRGQPKNTQNKTNTKG